MPEFKKPEPPKQPETKYVVSAGKFINAVKGLPFTSGNGLYRMKGKEITSKKLFPGVYFKLDDENEYVILKEAVINDTEKLEFLNKEITDYKIGFIFFKSILPGVNMRNTITGSWRLFSSFIKGDILIRSNSQSGNIIISENSQSGYIWIYENSQSGDILISSNSQSGVIWIDVNSQSGYISIRKNSQSGYISISENSQSGYISIGENSQSGYISISENSQSGYIWVRPNGQSEDISISGNSWSENIWIGENSQSGDISISENSQSGDISISENSQSGYIIVSENCQSGDISISSNSQSGNIWIYENSQNGEIKIYNSTCPQLNVTDNYLSLKLFNAAIPLMKFSNCFIPELTWQAGTRGELYISNSKINHLNLEHTSLLKDALISITDSELFIAQMNKLTVQGQLLLTNLKKLDEPFFWEPALKKQLTEEKPLDDTNELIKSIYQSKIDLLAKQEKSYSEKKEELVKSVSDKPLWRMASSSLGKTEITGCDLTGFVFEYRDSKLLDTFISGTKLPKDKIDIYNPDPEKELDDIDYFEQKISIYSQLKKIFENQGNIVEATWYHSKAMDNQQRLLQLNYRRQKKKWFSEEGFEFFNFKLNKLSNNHGESWRKALWFVLLSSLLVYILYYVSINYHKQFSFKGTGDFIGRFFSFLNFTRREDFMADKEQLNAFSYFFDYLGRVVTGFGIYQLIAAFRRHGRK